VIAPEILYGIPLTIVWRWFLAGSTALLAAGWLYQMGQWLSNAPALVELKSASPELVAISPKPDQGPDLTVIVPACNEAVSIEATLRSLLASTGIRLQILAVDDRSTDQTGQIMDKIMAQVANQHLLQTPEHSLQVMHIESLAPGWLGKPLALAAAAKLAQAQWILFTDGDVHFAPQALSLALGYAQTQMADHLVVMPDWIVKSPGEAAMHGAMHALSTWTLRLWRVSDTNARDFIGVGAFNLVRREVYEAVGGFAALRMEVLEDLRFGWTIKRAGYRQRVALGHQLVAVRWAHGAWGVVRNLEKNLFALYRYNLTLTCLACFGLAIQTVLPLLAIAAGGWTAIVAISFYLAVAGLYIASSRVTRVSPWYALVFPLGAGLFLFAMLRSMTLALLRGGVIWRGTLYSLSELRANAGRFW
jgi:glycosyltransferase involved in cell wall biosynthesis